MITLNQINKAFSDIAIAHKQINTYGMGDIWEIETSGTIRYPLLWANPSTSRFENNTYVSVWQLLVMDIVHKDEKNETDVMSDMELVALDLIALLKNAAYDFDLNTDNIPLEKFTERFTNNVAGIALTVELRIPAPNDRCAVPQTGLNVGSGGVTTGGIVTIINAVTGATIVEIQAPGEYEVYQWSGIDEGDSTTTYTDGITDE
jgi:hypothetical protein